MAFSTARVFVLLSIVVTGCVQSSADHGVLTVADVVDGDTIVIDGAHGTEQVRLLGIDTPETVDPSRPVQCFGAEASDRLKALLPIGTTIRLERDVEARDKYGRLLGYVFRSHDDLFVNELMLTEGMADLSIYAPNRAYETTLRHAFTTAQTASIGLWAECGGADVPLQPWEYE